MRDGEAEIAQRYRLLSPQLNERQRRAFAASEARTFGYGGIAATARACGLAENTVRKGLRELVGDDTRGDPERVLLWTAKSTRKLAVELAGRGHPVGFRTVPRLLRKLGYSLQSARKTLEGKQHPDRDAQFRHINDKVSAAIAARQPAISIDTKKKELVGEFKNAGQEWRPEGAAPKVNTYDFPSMAQGKAIPYGVYDIAEDAGFVSDRRNAGDRQRAGKSWAAANARKPRGS